MTEKLDDVKMRFVLKNLGRRIRETRLARGLSVRDMVVKHDYHDAQWRRYEKGASLTVPSLVRIALALEISLSLLVEGADDYSTSKMVGSTASGKHLDQIVRKQKREVASSQQTAL